MARIKKKLVVDMNDVEKDAHTIDLVSNFASLSDKISWTRKYDNMQKLIAQIHPIEEQITELRAQCLPIYDEIAELRQTMVEECVHPKEMLVLKEDFVECKFCNKRFTVK